MASTVIEVALKDLEEAESDRIEQLVETLANDIIPSLSEAAGVSGTDLAARLMAELGYIAGGDRTGRADRRFGSGSLGGG
jgi:predicted transcriptional regulator